MKILFLSQRVPYPPNKGDKLRSFNIIKHLASRHQISLACLTDNQTELEQARLLEDLCHSVDVVLIPKLHSKIRSFLALLSSAPLSLAYFHARKLQTLVDQKLKSEQFDLIFVYCSSMAQYVIDIRHLPKVIDFVDVDSEKWLQYSRHARFPWSILYRIESWRLRRYEDRVARSFQHGFLVSEKETEDFSKLVCDAGSLTPIANGVDAAMFHPAECPDQYDPHSLVFTGAMDYFANVEAVLYFVKAILPLIQEAVPEVKFYVVGSNPVRDIQRLPKHHPEVIVTGFVQAVQPYVTNCAAMVAPMRIARGVQNKILEAMALGVPVVASSLGFEGIAATAGVDIFVADAPEVFASQVIQLMRNSELRREVARRGREKILKHYDWNNNLGTLEQVLCAVCRADDAVPDLLRNPLTTPAS